MAKQRFSKAQLKELYDRLLQIDTEASDKDLGMRDKESPVWKTFSLTTISGRALYNDLSDEKLLDILRHKAKVLGYAPSQKEIFWVWRDYIKARFSKWPYALDQAGLPTSAGKGGKALEQQRVEKRHIEALLNQIREKALKLGRIPHPKDLPGVCLELKKYMNTWGEAIVAAGLSNQVVFRQTVYKIENLESDYLMILKQIRERAEELGRAPQHHEVSKEIKEKLIKRCGSWRNALYQVGLEPIIRITPFATSSLSNSPNTSDKSHKSSLQDCYYKILKPDQQTIEDLAAIQDVYKQLRRIPQKKEIPVEVRKRLQESCGSWSNALFQIGIINKEK